MGSLLPQILFYKKAFERNKNSHLSARKQSNERKYTVI